MRVRTTGFLFSVSGCNGALDAAYIRVSDSPRVARTVEIEEGTLLADYDARGKLTGIEILGPVRLGKMLPLIDEKQRAGFRAFVRKAAPREFLR